MQTKKLAYWGVGAVAAAALVAIAWWQFTPSRSATAQTAETQSPPVRPSSPQAPMVTPVASAPTETVALPPQAASVCGDNPRCVQVPSFVATVTDMRESVIPGTFPSRVVSLTVRFRNTTGGPLILGYVIGSGLVTDDLGNRYTIKRNGVSGLGDVYSGSVDPKFALQAGESGDGKFEFTWQPGSAVPGTRFDAEFAVRELEPLAGGNQWRPGREHALLFRGFGKPAVADASTPVGAAVVKPGG